jgi:hypothetical protein
MNFKIFGRMQSNPSIKLETEISPLDFGVELRGALSGELGPFSAHIGEIPIKVKIPFLRRERVVASLGGIPLSLDRFRVDVENAALEASGVVGMKGIRAVVGSQVECATDVQLNGKLSGRVGLSNLDLDGDKPDESDEWEKR